MNRISLKRGLTSLTFVFCVSIVSAQTQPYSCPGCDLRGHNFSGQDLTNANFTHAQLDQANFQGATLLGARFDHASLKQADFSKAVCGKSGYGPTSFVGADLTWSQFDQSRLEHTRFEFARLSYTRFRAVDLTSARFGLSLELDVLNEPAKPMLIDVQIGCDLAWAWPVLRTQNTTRPDCPGTASKPMVTALGEGVKLYTPGKGVVVPGTGEAKNNINRIHVSPTGLDVQGCGSAKSPCQTINFGLDQGITTYTENFELALAYGTFSVNDSTVALVNGASIRGGYYQGQPTHYQTLIQFCLDGSSTACISASGPNTIGLTNLAITSCRDTTGFGSSAQSMVLCEFAEQLALTNLDLSSVSRGTGGAGAPGAAQGQAPGGQEPNPNDSTGGAGGKTPASFNSSGGDGAPAMAVMNRCRDEMGTCVPKSLASPTNCIPPKPGLPGSTGQIPPPPQCSPPWFWMNTPNGHPTHSGLINAPPGYPGANATVGGLGGTISDDSLGNFSLLTGSFWTPSWGGAGTGGLHGAGGGGGPSGGYGLNCINACANAQGVPGGQGGGGGAGGYPGNLGTGGGMGAPAIGFLLIQSTLVVGKNVTITGGRGGQGGHGGNGGAGGQGGSGAAGVGRSQQAGDGGTGGNGGWGSPGGGGAGGNGGASLNIVQDNASSISGNITHYKGASGLPGGPGLGGTAQPGQSTNSGQGGRLGAVLKTYTLP